MVYWFFYETANLNDFVIAMQRFFELMDAFYPEC